MNKVIYYPIIICFFITICMFNVSASCQLNNEFLPGENITVCSQRCIYFNESLNNYQDCDDTINCALTVWYPNGSSLIQSQPMIRNNTIFEYRFGFLDTQGYYPSVISCDAEKGWQDTSFMFSILPLEQYPASSFGTIDRSRFLSQFSFLYSDLLFDINNVIYVNTLDMNGDYYDVYDLKVEVLNSADYDYDIKKIEDGKYKLSLKIPKQSIDDIFIKFTASDDYSSIEKIESFKIREGTLNEKLKAFSLNSVSALEDNLLILIIILFLSIIVFILAWYKYKS